MVIFHSCGSLPEGIFSINPRVTSQGKYSCVSCSYIVTLSIVNRGPLVYSLMWEKTCHKPPLTGNGNHTTYKNGDDWGMVSHCFTHITTHQKTHWISHQIPTNSHYHIQTELWPEISVVNFVSTSHFLEWEPHENQKNHWGSSRFFFLNLKNHQFPHGLCQERPFVASQRAQDIQDFTRTSVTPFFNARNRSLWYKCGGK